MKKISAICSTAIVLSFLCSCNVKAPITGTVSGTGETITGTAGNYKERSGMLDITLSSGVTCSGRFTITTGQVNNTTRKGVFHCSDGRNGPYSFTTARSGGNGYGTLDGKEFTFNFEDK